MPLQNWVGAADPAAEAASPVRGCTNSNPAQSASIASARLRGRTVVAIDTPVTLDIIVSIPPLIGSSFADFAAALKLYHVDKRVVLRKVNVLRRLCLSGPRELLEIFIRCVCTSRRRL
jgi:hypothetical protein